MSPTRRLRGIAAYSAVALASAGLAGSTLAADECTDAECLAEQAMSQFATEGLEGLMAGDGTLEFVRQMLEAQGLPQETIDQTMAIYEQMGYLGGGGGAGKVNGFEDLIEAFGGEDIPEGAMLKIEDAYAKLGIDPEDLFAGLELDEMAFPKVEDAEGDAFEKLEIDYGKPLDEAFIKFEADPELLDDLGGALGVAEAALTQAAAEGDIDPATLEAILGMLSDK